MVSFRVFFGKLTFGVARLGKLRKSFFSRNFVNWFVGFFGLLAGTGLGVIFTGTAAAGGGSFFSGGAKTGVGLGAGFTAVADGLRGTGVQAGGGGPSAQ